MTDIDILVDKILAKNTGRSSELVISLLKYHGLNAVHVSGRTYKITHRYEWHCQAQDAARKTKELLLHKCPELHIKSIKAYVEPYTSIVVFTLSDEDSRRLS